MRAYEDCLVGHGIPTAQILLTAGDFDNRARYLNVRNTILTLFEWDCLPIINENDTVSVAEIRFGDNDHLAAMVTNLIRAPLLVLLSNRRWSLLRRPARRSHGNSASDRAEHRRRGAGEGGQHEECARFRRHEEQAAGGPVGDGGGRVGHHGQRRHPGHSRRDFRRRADRYAVPTARQQSAVVEALARLHRPAARPARRGRRARKAIEKQGRSLLPIGVVQVAGSFHKGDVVSICDPDGAEFARGLTNYASGAADKIRGLRTDQIAEVLGACPYEEVVHRDNLAVIV